MYSHDKHTNTKRATSCFNISLKRTALFFYENINYNAYVMYTHSSLFVLFEVNLQISMTQEQKRNIHLTADLCFVDKIIGLESLPFDLHIIYIPFWNVYMLF